MIKTLCLGGSFNPIHHGHLICARAAAEAAGFERVLLIPSSQPPHKPDNAELASASDRLAMTRLAVASDPLFEVSSVEIARAGPSFTIDTARELKKQGVDEVHWLIGADLLPQLLDWREPDALLREVNFWVIQRPGSPIEWTSLSPPLAKLRDRLLLAPHVDISATEIRQRIRSGRPIDYLTPPSVITYIKINQLYGWDRP